MSRVINNIRKFRTDAGLSQRGLAAKLGVTGQTVYYWERGRMSPSEELLLKMQAEFGWKPSELIQLKSLDK